jgi:hypothetical protein
MRTFERSWRKRYNYVFGQVAQLVEQRIENPRVGGSIPPLATTSQVDTSLTARIHLITGRKWAYAHFFLFV